MNFPYLYWDNRDGKRLEGFIRETMELGRQLPHPTDAPIPAKK